MIMTALKNEMEPNNEFGARQWLTETRELLARIEHEAGAIAKVISNSENPYRGEELRLEWSRFVGCVTEFAVAISDMLPIPSDPSSAK